MNGYTKCLCVSNKIDQKNNKRHTVRTIPNQTNILIETETISIRLTLMYTIVHMSDFVQAIQQNVARLNELNSHFTEIIPVRNVFPAFMYNAKSVI